jgi:hypothetical protein
VKRAAVISNDAIAEEGAQEFMGTGGSAVGAVLAGFFASAGASAGVLLGPVSLLVGGVGTGARCFDGRMRQPGSGQKRPRGFKEGQAIPAAARVAVPSSVPALLIAHTYDGSQKLSSILRAGLQRAKRGGSDARVELLSRVRSYGGGAFSEASFVRALLRVAGPSEGGLIGPGDFGDLQEVDVPAVVRREGSLAVTEAPWAAEAQDLGDAHGLGTGFVVAAVDSRGVFAGLCYRRVIDGLGIDEFDLEAPLLGAPVVRGVERLSPGSRLPAPAPVALVEHEGSSLVELVAAPAALRLDPSRPTLRLTRNSQTLGVEASRPTANA